MIQVFEGFAGYGGASFGLARSGLQYNVVGYSEVDPDAIELYELNFPGIQNYGDIVNIDPNNLPFFNLFTGGFPCQPFSTVGRGLGEEDIRGTLFGDIIRICEVSQPQCILLENVIGLTRGKHEPTFRKILAALSDIGYNTRYTILNSADYGIPQSRKRLWIFGYLGEFPDNFNLTPPHQPLQGSLADFLDDTPDTELYRSPKQIARLHEVHKINSFAVEEPTCFDIYNSKLRTDGLCMTITPPEHNVTRIVEPPINGIERVRKLSLYEHYRLMGFIMNQNHQEIRFPDNQNYTRLGRRAGNGWDVNLTGILLAHIFNQLPAPPDPNPL